MPFCPRCHYEYRSGFETCADCGSALVEAPPDVDLTPVGHAVEEAAIARYQSDLEAQMCRELLRRNGIPAVLIQLTPGSRWLATDLVAQELRVRSGDVARAREILGLDAAE